MEQEWWLLLQPGKVLLLGSINDRAQQLSQSEVPLQDLEHSKLLWQVRQKEY